MLAFDPAPWVLGEVAIYIRAKVHHSYACLLLVLTIIHTPPSLVRSVLSLAEEFDGSVEHLLDPVDQFGLNVISWREIWLCRPD